jgi:hypothetical protein
LRHLLLQAAYSRTQSSVLLDYSELRGSDEVTEQGLGHDLERPFTQGEA